MPRDCAWLGPGHQNMQSPSALLSRPKQETNCLFDATVGSVLPTVCPRLSSQLCEVSNSVCWAKELMKVTAEGELADKTQLLTGRVGEKGIYRESRHSWRHNFIRCPTPVLALAP